MYCTNILSVGEFDSSISFSTYIYTHTPHTHTHMHGHVPKNVETFSAWILQVATKSGKTNQHLSANCQCFPSPATTLQAHVQHRTILRHHRWSNPVWWGTFGTRFHHTQDFLHKIFKLVCPPQSRVQKSSCLADMPIEMQLWPQGPGEDATFDAMH